jgi:hypothetical protein
MAGHPDSIEAKGGGFRAPGAGVLVVEDGTVWVALADGTRADLPAKSVVVYETDDWVEYGSDGQLPWTVRDYWAAMEPFEESQRRLHEIFGESEPAAPITRP